MHKRKIIWCSLGVALFGALLYGSFLFGKSSPPAIARLVSKPAAIAFEVKQADSPFTRFVYHDLGYDGTLDKVTVHEKNGKIIEFNPIETPRDTWSAHLKGYQIARGYAILQNE